MGSKGRGAFFYSVLFPVFIFVLSKVLPFGLSWLLLASYSSTYILPFINEKIESKKVVKLFFGSNRYVPVLPTYSIFNF
jgi:hypothetical protein